MRAANANDEHIDAKLVPRSGGRNEDLISAKDANSIGEEKDLDEVVTPKQADEDEEVSDDPKCGDEKPKILDTIAAEFDENPKKLVHQGTDVDEVNEKVDRVRQVVEGVSKCLRALLNLGCTFHALLPALIFFFGFLNKYLNTKSSD